MPNMISATAPSFIMPNLAWPASAPTENGEKAVWQRETTPTVIRANNSIKHLKYNFRLHHLSTPSSARDDHT